MLNATINKYAYSILTIGNSNSIDIHSLDYNITATFNYFEELQYNGELDLVKAAIKEMGIKQAFKLVLHTDAPPGTGLGSSATVAVAMVGAFGRWLKLPLTDYEIAQLAYPIERKELGIAGGEQDQYAATFGGINFIEFLGNKTIVNPLRIKANILNELEYRLLLCYTDRSRLSAQVINEQVRSYVRREEDVVSALGETKALAIDMKNALLLGQLDELGSLLHEAWCIKKKFSTKMSNPHIDELYEVARQNGVIGGKLLGGGGGGYLLLLCESDKRHTVLGKMEGIGGNITSLNFEFNGLQTWEVGMP